MRALVEFLRALPRRLRFHADRERHERELAEEMAFHLELKARDAEHDGMGAVEARFAARRAFGNPTRAREQAFEVMTIGWLDAIAQDARFAIRALRGSPAFALVAIASLAIGIGSALAVFSLVNVMVLKPLPYPEPGRLVVPFQTLSPGMFTGADTLPWQYSRFVGLRAGVSAFEGLGFSTWDEVNVRRAGAEPGGVDRLVMEFVTPSLFATLGAPPMLGRVLTDADEGGASGAPVAVLSERLWRRLFAADPSVLGAPVQVGSALATIVGVMPETYRGFRAGAELWMPLAARPLVRGPSARSQDPGEVMGTVVARVRAGVSATAAQGQLATAAAEMNRADPPPFGRAGATWGAGLIALDEARRHPLVTPLLTLLALAVAGVLLIVCANIAGLLLARARAREAELGVRIALGAGHGRLARQLLTESVLLAVLGGIPGIVLGHAGAAALVRFRPELPAAFVLLRGTDLLDGVSLAPDWRVALATVLLVVLTGLLFGAAPALAARRIGVAELLKLAGGRAATRPARGRRVLVVGQVALATMLLVGAGLTVRSFRALVRADVGFDPSGLVMLRVSASESGPAAAARRAEALRNVAALPGVLAVSPHNCVPFAGDCMMSGLYRIDDREVARGEYPPIEQHVVSPDYLRVMRTRLVDGRSLQEGDRAAGTNVLVNETAARLLWKGTSPIGHYVSASMDPDAPPLLVVGVIADARFDGLSDPVRPAVFRTFADDERSPGVLFVRTRGTPEAVIPAIRRAIASAEPGSAIHGVTTGRLLLRRASASVAFVSVLLTAFAGVAALLAVLGVYGVLAYLVTQRRREFGVRLAIGATPASVLRLVVRQGVVLTLAGVALGACGAFAAAGALTQFLHGVERGDPPTYVAIVGLVTMAGLFAAWIPARRATRVDPMLALRE